MLGLVAGPDHWNAAVNVDKLVCLVLNVSSTSRLRKLTMISRPISSCLSAITTFGFAHLDNIL